MSFKSNLTNHNASRYQTNASFVYSSANSSPVLNLLDAQAGEKIIDLGCGNGELTVQLKEAVGDQGEIIGVDSNENMLTSARSNSPSSIQYFQADIQDFNSFSSAHPELKGRFDKVFTSATLHWCKSSPSGVVELVKWLLKDGGKFAFEFGGFGNCVGIRSALHQSLRKRNIDPIPLDPWYFPTVAQYESVLTSIGLTPQTVQLVPRPTPLPTSLRGWLDTFARNSFLSSLNDEDAGQVLDEVVELSRVDNYWSEKNPGVGLRSNSDSDEGKDGWEVMYVRLRGVAIKS
ncbi:uncharacterized protein IL334_002948 [Kwoniella shivajii]|uniref:Methyltransferase domain-containing protein n=1 Tax=Kwoniella shivajii TaxID=564305 RepID=A0ABZ1D0B6_9TREE|nr:hypothetical protein IL334_002948 [Kwoniella shivajii]